LLIFYIFEAPKRTRFCDILPKPPARKPVPADQKRANPRKPPNLLFTSNETLEFVKEKKKLQDEKEMLKQEKEKVIKDALKELRKGKREAVKREAVKKAATKGKAGQKK
jgi:hypothetical protein